MENLDIKIHVSSNGHVSVEGTLGENGISHDLKLAFLCAHSLKQIAFLISSRLSNQNPGYDECLSSLCDNFRSMRFLSLLDEDELGDFFLESDVITDEIVAFYEDKGDVLSVNIAGINYPLAVWSAIVLSLPISFGIEDMDYFQRAFDTAVSTNYETDYKIKWMKYDANGMPQERQWELN